MDDFFENSEGLDYMVLRPLSVYTMNWELLWTEDNNKYIEEPNSFAALLNQLLLEISNCPVPVDYHKYEDILAENVIKDLKWPLKKVGKKWVGADYQSIITQGGFGDYDQENLIKAVAGRVARAKSYGHVNFEDMDNAHARTLAFILTAILYHRTQLLILEDED